MNHLRRSSFFIMLLVFAVAVLFGDTPSSRASNFQIARQHEFYRDLNVPGNFDSGIAFFRIDLDIFAGCEGRLSKLRILDSNETFKPYAIRINTAETRESIIPGMLLNQSTDAGNRSRIEIDTGVNPVMHNRILLATTSINFLRKVTVEGSDDRSQWWVLKDDALVFSFNQSTEQKKLDVEYPSSNYRYLRITVESGGNSPVALTGASVYRRVFDPGLDWTVAELHPDSLEELDSPKRTRWTVDLGSEGIPHSLVCFSTSESRFFRDIDVYSGPTTGHLEKISRDAIYQYEGNKAHAEKLRIEFPETSHRYLILDLINLDDPPLEIHKITVGGAARVVFLDVRPGEKLQVFYGGNLAVEPQYDFEKIYQDLKPDLDRELNLDPPKRNPGFQRDALDQIESWKPYSTWIALIVAAAVLGLITWRQIRRS